MRDMLDETRGLTILAPLGQVSISWTTGNECSSSTMRPMFTATSDIGAMALEEGASAYLAKPFRPEELVATIEDIPKAQQEET
jgi:CheY-like chemotaxis protein